jgi:hypothetical protein
MDTPAQQGPDPTPRSSSECAPAPRQQDRYSPFQRQPRSKASVLFPRLANLSAGRSPAPADNSADLPNLSQGAAARLLNCHGGDDKPANLPVCQAGTARLLNPGAGDDKPANLRIKKVAISAQICVLIRSRPLARSRQICRLIPSPPPRGSPTYGRVNGPIWNLPQRCGRWDLRQRCRKSGVQKIVQNAPLKSISRVACRVN